MSDREQPALSGHRSGEKVRLQSHYRKARRDDVRCWECEHYWKPFLHNLRGRCGSDSLRIAVGGNMTCDAATSKALSATQKGTSNAVLLL